MDTLNDEEIKIARKIINANHKLSNTPLHKVFSIFGIFKRKEILKEHLIDDSAAKEEGKMEEESDALNFLGFGLIAYRDLMFTMFKLFALLSFIMLPAMYYYSAQLSGDNLVEASFKTKWSLGSFGYSSSQCKFFPAKLQDISFVTCPYGFVSKINYAGIIPRSS